MASDFVKSFLFPLLVPVLIGIGSAAMTLTVATIRLEERMATLERNITRHETDTTKRVERHDDMLSDMARRDADQEQRLVRGESFMDAMRNDLTEIKGDVKTLIRGGSGGKR